MPASVLSPTFDAQAWIAERLAANAEQFGTATMATTDESQWVPIDLATEVISSAIQSSVIEKWASPQPLRAPSKLVDRIASISAVSNKAKGGAYNELAPTDDKITMYRYTFGDAYRITEEDIADIGDSDDLGAAYLESKHAQWLSSYAVALDNACLAVTAAARNGTTVPYVSVYASVRATDSNAGYTADTNYILGGLSYGGGTFTDAGDLVTFSVAPAVPTGGPNGATRILAVGDKVTFQNIASTTGITAGTSYFVKTAPSSTTATLSTTSGGSTLALTTDGTFGVAKQANGTATYDDFNNVLALVEDSRWFDPSQAVVFADYRFKKQFRGIKDYNGNPIFVPSTQLGVMPTLFDIPIQFTHGCKTSATVSANPTGNPLLIVANKNLLMLGMGLGPVFALTDPKEGPTALTGESMMIMQSQRGFVFGNAFGAAVLEIAS